MALRGVILDRAAALHAIRCHYLHPNVGVRRWTSHLRAVAACDATFEIDAHVAYPRDWVLAVEDYEPIIEVAAGIGRRLYDHLVAELEVDPRYITASITRMGVRLDVDWRAFGFRRAWMVAAVVRWVGRQVFPAGLGDYQGQLAEAVQTRALHRGHGEAINVKVEIDTRMFEGSDQVRLDGSGSRGGTLRAIGSLHSASSPRIMWVRSTPVPHEHFRAEHAGRLTRASRNHSGPEPACFPLPALFGSGWLARQPACRDPGGDRIIEEQPQPSGALIELFERASECRTWVFRPKIRQREKRILVADRSYSQAQLKRPEEWARVIETVRVLIEHERARTGMPVAVIGISKVMNRLLGELLPGGLPKELAMPWPRGRREECFAELRTACEPFGVLPGYAHGVSGSNAFVANPGELPARFVRSLIVLGNIQPPLGDVAAQMRGVFSAFGACDEFKEINDLVTILAQTPVDWTVVRRRVAIPGTEMGEGDTVRVKALTNVMGFADDRANDLLHASYGAELVQIVGRIRGVIPDPEGIEARAYIVAGLAAPGLEIDQVVTLDELREELGLPGEQREEPKEGLLSLEKIAVDVKRRGKGETLRRLTCGLFAQGFRWPGKGPQRSAIHLAEAALVQAGYQVTDQHRARAIKAIRDRDPPRAGTVIRDLDDLVKA
ncbi:MAG: hypothetical protein KF718_02480 [Polyangiaceae bacterium]|nr:hypothetical protein [Polyangiaceae bacterium]